MTNIRDARTARDEARPAVRPEALEKPFEPLPESFVNPFWEADEPGRASQVGGRRKEEDRRQKAEDRRQKTEDRR